MIRIDAGVLIPGRGDPIPDGSVVLDGGDISYAGPRDQAPAGDYEVTSVAAAMPGMWDCHSHYTGLSAPNIELELLEDVVHRAARATADLGRTLDGGITSVREVGGLGIELRHAIDEGAIRGPSIYSSGGILSTTSGHSDVHSFPLDWVLQTSAAGKSLGVIADGVPECLKAVRKQLRRGADVIKVCASGGVISELDHPMHQQFSDEELRAIVEEAARAERAVAAHCHGKAGIMAALRAGVKTIEHGSYLDEEAAEAMVETDTLLVPTRYVIEQLLGQEDLMPAYAYRKGVIVSEASALAIKIAIAGGVRLATGCDIFFSSGDYGRNGREVGLLINAGLTPLEAIEAATANGPETLGPQAPMSGQLVAGYDADVIAFDVDPTTDVAVWGDADRITHIWKAGELVKEPT